MLVLLPYCISCLFSAMVERKKGCPLYKKVTKNIRRGRTAIKCHTSRKRIRTHAMCCYCVCCTVSDFILYIIATFFPPVAVLFRSGPFSSYFLLNVLLTLLGFLPGMLHAFYYITITSPLRNAEYVYYYQQGWVDSERNVPSNRPQDAQTSQHGHQQGSSTRNVYPTIQTPLLQGTAPHDNKQSTIESPPPYVP